MICLSRGSFEKNFMSIVKSVLTKIFLNVLPPPGRIIHSESELSKLTIFFEYANKKVGKYALPIKCRPLMYTMFFVVGHSVPPV